jgi:hypothetical protein
MEMQERMLQRQGEADREERERRLMLDERKMMLEEKAHDLAIQKLELDTKLADERLMMLRLQLARLERPPDT